MKCPQTKFHPDNISHVKVLGKKSQYLSLGQNLSLSQNFLTAECFVY